MVFFLELNEKRKDQKSFKVFISDKDQIVVDIF